MDATDALKEYVEGKVAKLSRFYDNVQTIEVTLEMEADKPSVEIVVSAKRKNTFVATHRADDMYACVDQALHKISEQLRRHKDKVRHRQGLTHSERLEQTGQ
jgi:putative sigma-54 modulation protein